MALGFIKYEDPVQELTIEYPEASNTPRADNSEIKAIVDAIWRARSVGTFVINVLFQPIEDVVATHELVVTLDDDRLARYSFSALTPTTQAEYTLNIGGGSWQEVQTLTLPDIRTTVLDAYNNEEFNSLEWKYLAGGA